MDITIVAHRHIMQSYIKNSGMDFKPACLVKFTGKSTERDIAGKLHILHISGVKILFYTDILPIIGRASVFYQYLLL